jgi:hypothetical protein
VAAHYTTFFAIITADPNSGPPAINITAQDRADMVTYVKLL